MEWIIISVVLMLLAGASAQVEDLVVFAIILTLMGMWLGYVPIPWGG